MIDDKTDKLIFKGIRSAKQRLFIELYCNPESESYDNGCQSYLKAYNSDNSNVGAVEAHRLLGKENVQNAISSYKAYIADQNGFELNWLDNNLRNLYYKVKGFDMPQMELKVLKTIGDRIGAFTDTKEDSKGIVVEMTPEKEKLVNKVFEEIMAEEKRKQIKKAN